MNRLLVVDDKEDNVYYLRALLEGQGWFVESASHGAEALVKARQSPPDLVVSDLLMPVMDGYTLLRHWKSDPRLRAVRFVVYTATYTRPEDERLAFDLGADGFILKPSEPEDFMARIREVLARSRSEPPEAPSTGSHDEHEKLRLYSQTLIRKLEEKTLQLEATNKALEEDIAKRRLAESALRASEAEFRLLADAVPQIVWLSRPDGACVYLNQHWSSYTGRSCADGLGYRWQSSVHPDDCEQVIAAWERAVASGTPYSTEGRMRRADGAYRWWLIRSVPRRDDTGAIVKWFGTCTDIDDLKQAEARLANSEALLRIAGASAHLGGWSVSIPSLVVTWSDEMCAIHDVPSGTTPTLEEAAQFYAPDYRAALQAHIEACAREGKPFDTELQLVTAAGRRIWVRATGRAERDAEGRIVKVQGALQDIDRLHRLEEQLRQVQKMEAVGQLAGGVAHDFNNLLSVILGYSSFALAALPAESAVRGDLEEVLKAGQRATSLTQQLLAFSRQQVLQPRIVDVGQVVLGMEKMLRRLLNEDVELSLTVAPSVGFVYVDPTQIEQVVLNLVVNARDAMPLGGGLVIEVASRVFAQAEDGINEGRYVVLSVTDTGVGIETHALEHIFEPFFTTKERGKGTGLGLSTVFGIVEQSRGYIRVESRVGQGTTFRVYFPRNDESARLPTMPPPAPSTREGSETVMIVEDDNQLRTMMSAILRRHGYTVLDAQNGGEAFLLCEKLPGELHLLVTDVVMPRMSGRELAERLERMRPRMRTLYVSGYAEDSIAHHGVLLPGLALLQKPFTPEALLLKVREVLDDGAEAPTRRH